MFAKHSSVQFMVNEMNHRVANSLQIVSALVSIEERNIVDPVAREALRATGRRIGAVARVHRKLYNTLGSQRIDLGAYLSDLAVDLQESCSTPTVNRPIVIEAESLSVSADSAISIGVIVTELFANVCKYAYSPDEPGGVHLTLLKHGMSGFTLMVEDFGCGRSADFV